MGCGGSAGKAITGTSDTSQEAPAPAPASAKEALLSLEEAKSKFSSEDLVVCSRGAKSLWYYKEEGAKILAEGLSNGKDNTRHAACLGFIEFGKQEFLEQESAKKPREYAEPYIHLLGKALEDKHPFVRRYACAALGSVGWYGFDDGSGNEDKVADKVAAENDKIKALLADEDGDVRWEAVETLKAIKSKDEPGVDEVIKLFGPAKNEKTDDGQAKDEGPGKDEARIVAALVALAPVDQPPKGDEPPRKAQCYKHHAKFVAKLVTKDASVKVKCQVCVTLAVMKSEEEVVVSLLKDDPEKDVRMSAAKSLGSWGERRFVPILEARIGNAGSSEEDVEKDEKVRILLEEARQKIADGRFD